MKAHNPKKSRNLAGVHVMGELAIVDHSAHGHTEFIARAVLVGARQVVDVEASRPTGLSVRATAMWACGPAPG